MIHSYQTAKETLNRLSRFNIENDDDVKDFAPVESRVTKTIIIESKENVAVTATKEVSERSTARAVLANDLEVQSLSPCRHVFTPQRLPLSSRNGTLSPPLQQIYA